jgi:hypothetical protein
MRHISLDREDERIKKFVRSLPVDGGGCILELEGQPLLKVLPVADEPVDKAKLKAAILKRRDESRTLNQEWDGVDREMWDKIADTET